MQIGTNKEEEEIEFQAPFGFETRKFEFQYIPFFPLVSIKIIYNHIY